MGAELQVGEVAAGAEKRERARGFSKRDSMGDLDRCAAPVGSAIGGWPCLSSAAGRYSHQQKYRIDFQTPRIGYQHPLARPDRQMQTGRKRQTGQTRQTRSPYQHGAVFLSPKASDTIPCTDIHCESGLVIAFLVTEMLPPAGSPVVGDPRWGS